MKILDSEHLQRVSAFVFEENVNFHLDGLVESYSCKMDSDDKRLYMKIICKKGGPAPNTLHALSPSVTSSLGVSTSPVSRQQSYDEDEAGGLLCDAITTKTLFHLKTTLNESFPDYDFTDAGSVEFSREHSLEVVKQTVNSYLDPEMAYVPNWKDYLWKKIDEEITLEECEIYSYIPDLSSDPYGVDSFTWCFNFFFFNKQKKRMVFFTCKASNLSISDDASDPDMQFDMEN